MIPHCRSRRVSIHLAAALATLLAGGSAAPRALADGQTTAAESLFAEGKKLIDQKKFDEACPKFEQSYKLDPADGTLAGLAFCMENTGRLATAWTMYRDLLSNAQNAGNAARVKFAKARLAVVEPKLSKVIVQGPADTPGLEVKWDGAPFAVGAEVPVDGGTHTLIATASGKKQWETKVEIATEKDRKTVTVPPLEEEPKLVTKPPLPIGDANPAPPPPKNPIDAPPAVERTSRPLFPLLVAGGGVILIGVGGYFAFSARSKNDSSNAAGVCEGNHCTPEGRALRDDAFKRADVATVLLASGAAVAAGGLLWWAFSPTNEPRKTTVSIGPGGLFFAGQF